MKRTPADGTSTGAAPTQPALTSLGARVLLVGNSAHGAQPELPGRDAAESVTALGRGLVAAGGLDPGEPADAHRPE